MAEFIGSFSVRGIYYVSFGVFFDNFEMFNNLIIFKI